MFFKKLDESEAEDFRKWARENYKAGAEISMAWHPVVQEECARINAQTFIASPILPGLPA